MDLLRRLEFSASNPNHPRRIEYLLELCEFYAIGIGTSPSQELRITCLKKAKLYGSRYAAAVLKSLGQSSEDLQDQDTVPRGAAMRQENPFLDYTRSLQSDNILYNLEVQKIEEMALGGWYPDQIEKFLVDTAHNKKLSRSFTVSFKRSHEDSKQLQIPLLHYAAFRNDLRVMQLALDYGLNVDTVDASSGQTALICALSYGQYEAAKLLLINGANASKAAYSGLNPFHCLCLVPDEYLVTLAHYALRLGDTQGLLSSVCHDEYLYMLSFSGTPLDYAAMIGNLNAVKIMLGGAQEIYKSRPKVLEDAIEMAARNLYADICQSIGGIDTTLSGHPLHVLGLTSVHSLDLRHGLNKATALNSTIKTLQALGYSINAKATGTGWENGMTPLSFAVISNPGCPDIVCALIEHGADTEALNEDGSTALLCAIFAAENSRNEGYVSLLLARGASAVRTTQCNDAGSPRFRGVDSQPLHRACEANAQGAVQCLLAESNIDINARDGYGQTPLHIACGRNRIPLIRLLMDANAEINTIDNEGCSPLEEAVRKGCSATAIYLLDLGVSVFNIASPTRRSILMYALSFYVTRAQSEACLNLLRHEHIRQQDVLDWADETGHTAIGKAILTGQYAAAHELLKLGVPIHHPPLRASIYPAGISPLLLMIGSNVTLDFLGHLEDYEKLLHTMVDMVHLGGGLEAREITGSTALHYACKMTNLVAVQILLTKGADTKATKILGQTPLHSAIRGVVKKLRRKPDDEDSLDGPTANEEQLEDRLIQIIDLLLVHGAEIDAADDFGYTTLHDAIMAPDFSAEMAQLLLQKGASVSQKTHQGETPLHMVIIGNKYRRDTYEPFFGARSDWPIPDNGSERARILIKDLIRNKASLECLPGEDYNILDKAILNNRLSEARCLADLGVRSSIGTEKILDWQIAEQHRPSESAQQRRPRRLSL